MFINKYKPDDLQHIIGNKTSITSIQNWFENWYAEKEPKTETKTNPKIKTHSKKECICALLSGPNGIGKTLAAELLIKKYDLNPITLNPDEKADKEYIAKTIIPSIQTTKSFTKKQNIFVIHDIDCYDDYGFISSIVNCLKETKIPVIATCNNRYDQSLKPLISYCLDVKFQKPNTCDVVKFVKQIIKKESIVISDANLNQIIEDSNCDVRNTLNNLQLLGGNTNMNMTSKDNTNTNIFEVTKQFMYQNVELDDKQRLFWTNNDIIPLMIHENYPANNIKMKNEACYLNNIAESIHSLSDIDLFEKDIHMNGNWELMPYTAWCSIKSVANCHTKTMIKFTSFFEKRASKKQTMNYVRGSGGSGGIIKNISNVEEKTKAKKKSSPKTTVKLTKSKEPKEPKEPKQPKSKLTKTKEPKPKAIKIEPTLEIADEVEVQEKPKIVRRKKVKLIIDE
jgi:replication factor C subunit 1